MKAKPSPIPTPERIEIFAHAIVSGLDQSKAYREMHPISKKWQDPSVHKKATTWIKVESVQSRIDELRQELSERKLITTEKKRDALWQITTEALDGKGKKSDAVSAVKELNKMDGDHSPIKVEHGLSDDQKLLQKIRISFTFDEIMEVYRLQDEDGMNLETAYRKVKDVRKD